ncbi:MAG: PhzF family phenazine biosynthesis protein [Aureliella sp.]
MNDIFVVDSFTDRAYRGNPAGVRLVGELEADARMQNIAQELNLSETAFVAYDREKEVQPIRFFSPKMEIPLCGHATLAAAKVLFETEGWESLTFENVDGLKLNVTKVADQIEMQFPIYRIRDASAPSALLAALQVQKVVYCGFNEETQILMLELTTTEEVCRLKPDFRALLSAHDSINGVVVTAQADDKFDFYSRYFWPWSGGDEDPVTGGTQTFLASYWSRRLGKSKLRSYQASQRGGQIEVEVTNKSLWIRGAAVIVLQGNLLV